MAIEYTRDDRGARVFQFAGNRYRAFWLQCGHEWSISEIDADGKRIGPEGRNWHQKNWAAVESFMTWLAKLDGRAA